MEPLATIETRASFESFLRGRPTLRTRYRLAIARGVARLDRLFA